MKKVIETVLIIMRIKIEKTEHRTKKMKNRVEIIKKIIIPEKLNAIKKTQIIDETGII